MSVMIIEFPEETPGLTSEAYDDLLERLGAFVVERLTTDLLGWEPSVYSVPTKEAWRSLADIPEETAERLLTVDEHLAIWLTARLADLFFQRIMGRADSAAQDGTEFGADIHRIQYRIMAQAAARAYPDHYRLQGKML